MMVIVNKFKKAKSAVADEAGELMDVAENTAGREEMKKIKE